MLFYRRVIFILLPLGVSLLLSPLMAQALEPGAVQAFMSEMETATQKRDYPKVVSMMSPAIHIHLRLNQERDLYLNRNQYLQNAVVSGMSYSQYSYKSHIESIQIVGQRAIVTFKVYEKAVSAKDGAIYCVMNDKAEIEVSQGRLVMTKLLGNGYLSKQKLF
jgi:hypothetical protein